MNICLYKVTFCMAFLLILLMQSLAFAMDPSVEDVIKKYYTADLNGAKFSGNTYEATISPLIVWENEQGWDISTVTNKVYILNVEKVSGNEVRTKVRYENIGVASAYEVVEEKSTEDIEFVLGNGCIDESIFYPNDALTLKLHSSGIVKYEDPDDKEYPIYIFFDETLTDEARLKERLKQMTVSAAEIETVLTVWRKARNERDQWKIKSPIFQPHVSPKAIITHFKTLIRNTPAESNARIKELEKIIQKLEALTY